MNYSSAFAKFIFYKISIILCYQILIVVFSWHLYDQSNNILFLGFIGLAEVLPYFASVLFAGHIIDFFIKKRLIAFGCFIFFILAFLMFFLSKQPVFLENIQLDFLIFGCMAMIGILKSVMEPANQVLFSSILKRSEYVRGATINASIFQASSIAGPALGGFLIGVLGISMAYLVAAFFAILAFLFIMLIKYQEKLKTLSNTSTLFRIREGLQFIWRKEILLGVMLLDMLAVLFGGATSMLPAFIKDVLHEGPESFGVLRAIPALGSLCIGLWLIWKPIKKHAGMILLFAIFGFGFSIILFGLSSSIGVAFICLFASGFFDGISVVVRSAIFHLTTPNQMKGRVSAINGIFIGCSNEIGSIESAFAASLIGLTPSIILGGIITLFIGMIFYFKMSKLRRFSL